MGASTSIGEVSAIVSNSFGNGVEEIRQREVFSRLKKDDGAENNETPVSVTHSEPGSQDKSNNYGSADIKNSVQSQTKVEQSPRDITDSTESSKKSEEQLSLSNPDSSNNEISKGNGFHFLKGQMEDAQK